MFAKLAVISMLVAVTSAAMVDVKDCEMKNSTAVEWDSCTAADDMWMKLTLVSGTVADDNATATWGTYGNNDCTGVPSETETLMCDCVAESKYQLVCDAAAGVIPSAILIIAAIMAHLY